MNKLNQSYFITTLGCSKNLVDSEMLVYALDKQGLQRVNDPGEAEIIIVNTCGFIEAAQQESINAILEGENYKKNGQCRCLVVTGCLSQKFGRELYDSLPEINILLGTGNFLQLPDLLRNNETGSQRFCQVGKPDFCYPEPGKRTLLTPRYSAYLKIAEGCSNCCSYCVIPSVRGRLRSRPKETVLAEAEMLVREGAKEINLIAQDTSAYGLDITDETNLARLLEDMSAIDGIGWIRFLYTYPTKITQELLEVVKSHESICRYIDLPLQHVNERILGNMNRKGSRESLCKLVDSIRNTIPDVTLRTTFIVGFPGETEREFQELMAFMEKIQFDWVGVFPFSPQEGTPAYSLQPAVSNKEACRRADELIELQRSITHKRNMRWLNRTLPVLVEGKSEDSQELYTGRTQGQAPEVDGMVLIKGAGEQDIGEILNVRITHVEEYDLFGEVAR